MSIEKDKYGNITVTGEHIALYRLLTLKHALALECDGIRVFRGTTAYAVVKREFGFKGNKEKVLAQFEAHIASKFPLPKCPQCGEVCNAPNDFGMAKCFACHFAFEAGGAL